MRRLPHRHGPRRRSERRSDRGAGHSRRGLKDRRFAHRLLFEAGIEENKRLITLQLFCIVRQAFALEEGVSYMGPASKVILVVLGTSLLGAVLFALVAY